jgi:hypothetical protein
MSGDKKESKLAKKEEVLIRIPLSPALLYIFSTFFGVGECTRLFFGLLQPLPPFFSSSDESSFLDVCFRP